MSKKSESVEFGDEVRMRRRALSLTMDQLAERAELTPNHISTIENGKRDPSLSTIELLAHGLGIPVGALLGKVAVLSPKAHEMATLFDQAPLQLQAGILMILRATAKPGTEEGLTAKGGNTPKADKGRAREFEGDGVVQHAAEDVAHHPG